MARPRVLTIPGLDGEIVLRNFTPEQCQMISDNLNRLGGPGVVRGPEIGDIVEVKPDEPIKVVDVTELKETAIGLFHNREKLEYQVVVVKYNPVSGAAKVVEMKNGGSFRLAGVNSLKMELVNLGMV